MHCLEASTIPQLYITYSIPMSVKVPIQVRTSTFSAIERLNVFTPYTILGVLQPGGLHRVTIDGGDSMLQCKICDGSTTNECVLNYCML